MNKTHQKKMGCPSTRGRKIGHDKNVIGHWILETAADHEETTISIAQDEGV